MAGLSSACAWHDEHELDVSPGWHCGMCSNERQADFEFIFASVKKRALVLLNSIVSPTSVISDALKSIQNALKTEFGQHTTTIMCWAHMFRCIKKKLITLVKTIEVREQIGDDIFCLQTVATEALFKVACSLFFEKWEGEVNFLTYFTEEWINKNPNWYEEAVQHQAQTTHWKLPTKIKKSSHSGVDCH